MADDPGEGSPSCYPVHQFLFSTPSGSVFQVLILSQGVANRQ
jgi:hypothetical protein